MKMNESIKISALRKSKLKTASGQDLPQKQNNDKKDIGFRNILTKEISFKKPFPDNVKESFYLELNSLMKAGLDLGSALQLLCEEQKKNIQKRS